MSITPEKEAQAMLLLYAKRVRQNAQEVRDLNLVDSAAFGHAVAVWIEKAANWIAQQSKEPGDDPYGVC